MFLACLMLARLEIGRSISYRSGTFVLERGLFFVHIDVDVGLCELHLFDGGAMAFFLG